MNCKTLAAAMVLSLIGMTAAQAGILDLFKSSPVDTVKEGLLPEYSTTVRVGPALENYYDCVSGTASWESFESVRGENIVEFQCVLGEEHRNDLNDPQIIAIAETGAALAGVMRSLSGEKGSEVSFKDAVADWQELRLKVQFALSQLDDGAFEIAYVGLSPTYSDGLVGTIPLTHGTLSGVYDNTNLFDADLSNYASQEEGFWDLVGDVIKARTEALQSQ